MFYADKIIVYFYLNGSKITFTQGKKYIRTDIFLKGIILLYLAVSTQKTTHTAK